jgi:transposase
MCVPHAWNYKCTHQRTGGTEYVVKRTYLHLYYLPTRVVKEEEGLAQLLHRLHSELEHDNRQDEHKALYEHYFKRIRGGKYEGRIDVIEAERAAFGYFALLTNDAQLSAHGALKVYRAKDMIEKAFGDIKERLDFRTPKVENTETLRGKLLAVFVALILACELRKRMAAEGLYDRYTMQGLIDELDIIERYECEGHRPRVLAVTQKQRKLYEALKINPLNV